MIINEVGNNRDNRPDDIRSVKRSFKTIGLYNEDEISPYIDRELDNAIQFFQQDNKLKVDRKMKPKGETENLLKDMVNVVRDIPEGLYQQAGAVKDFTKNWLDMREADTIDADKYFHCKANYEAAKRGKSGYNSAVLLSGARELYGQWIKGDPLEDAAEDIKANKHGRVHGRFGTNNMSAQEACHKFRPRGLDEKY